jgi:hypothetical protein
MDMNISLPSERRVSAAEGNRHSLLKTRNGGVCDRSPRSYRRSCVSYASPHDRARA